METGRLRHQISIQQNTATVDAAGQPGVDWQTIRQPWAEVKPVVGGENFNGSQILAGVTHLVTIRYQSGISPTMRVLYGSRILHIESVLNIDERNRETRLQCKEMAS